MILTQQQQDKISNAVLSAETKTTGEIVPMIIGQSDDYPGARWRVSIVCALLFGFITYSLINADFVPAYINELDSIWILWLQIPGLYIGYWLSSFSPLRSTSTCFTGFLFKGTTYIKRSHQHTYYGFIIRTPC